nr:hypothetical protein [Tanacetum cinerariifolium]
DSDTSLTPPIATPTPITTAAPVPRLSTAAKGKQPTKAKSSYDLSKAAMTEAEQLKIVLKRSRQETHISKHGGSSTDEGTGSKPGVSDVLSDESKEEISWKSSNDEDETLAKIDKPEDTESGRGGDEVTESEEESDEEETRKEEEESFDPIPRTPKGSEDEGNDEEDQDLRLSKEARIQKEEEADELYRCLPLAAADILGTGAAVIVGVAIGGVREVSKSPLFFLALAFGFGAATLSPRIRACIFLAHLQSQGKPKRKDISAEHRIQLVELIPWIESNKPLFQKLHTSRCTPVEPDTGHTCRFQIVGQVYWLSDKEGCQSYHDNMIDQRLFLIYLHPDWTSPPSEYPLGHKIQSRTGSRPGVPDVPSDDSEEELSWNSFDDEDVDAQDEGDKSDDESDDGNDDDNDETVKDGSKRDNDDEEALAKIDEPEDTESGRGGDEVTERESNEEKTRQKEEESFDPIPRTPEGSEDEGNDEEDQDLRLREEAIIQEEEEEEADELYRDVDINQGRGLQVSQNIEDSHVTLTPVHHDGLQESSSVSSFVTSMLNPIIDTGVESIFTTTSSLIVSLQTPTPIMNPSTIATITTSSDAPIHPTIIPSTILKNLPTFNLLFRFNERLKENDEFLRNIDENMKKIIKGQVKSQVKEQVSRILPRIEKPVNATLEAEVLTKSSHSSRTSYAVAADLSEMELKKILIEKMEGNKSIQRSDEQRNLYKALVEAYDADKTILDTYGESTILKRRREDDDQEGPSAGSERGSKR